MISVPNWSGFRPLLVGFVCSSVILGLLHSSESPSASVNPFSYRELERKWAGKFDERPKDAYAEFVETAHALPYGDAHTLAHIVGAILYNRGGLASLSHCTDDFAFGCYHGFAGAVIEEMGITGVGKFADACKSQQSATNCEHGIGQGLLAYLGSAQLVDALELCPHAPSSTVRGCYNGIFMEYFLSTLQRNEGIPKRTLDLNVPEEPCRSAVPTKFQAACYYELPAWWRAWAEGIPYEEQFKVIGTRCESVADSNLREVCFQGAGAQIAVFSKYDMNLIQKWCSNMPQPGRASCMSEALRAAAGSEHSSKVQQPSL